MQEEILEIIVVMDGWKHLFIQISSYSSSLCTHIQLGRRTRGDTVCFEVSLKLVILSLSLDDGHVKRTSFRILLFFSSLYDVQPSFDVNVDDLQHTC